MSEWKDKVRTNIATVVSFDGSSVSGLKIVMQHTDGSQVTLTTLASVTRDGMNYIRTHGLSEMFETSGAKAIAEQKEIGNEQS